MIWQENEIDNDIMITFPDEINQYGPLETWIIYLNAMYNACAKMLKKEEVSNVIQWISVNFGFISSAIMENFSC